MFLVGKLSYQGYVTISHYCIPFIPIDRYIFRGWVEKLNNLRCQESLKELAKLFRESYLFTSDTDGATWQKLKPI